MTGRDIQLQVLKGVRLFLMGLFWFLVLLFCLAFASIKTPLPEDKDECLVLLGMIVVMGLVVVVREWIEKKVIKPLEKRKQG